ncbi:family 16 glycosylhydrolase [Microbulbifer elongatus]|uniref:Family 16 glycosylhydrolase n=1 Tax=Microbulbifer elongatus TaxID=86173 RepID=A0ABT1P7R8_9GAMM|nr:family 16 glycosylhydrolase [Microbulbifer elongatus]MCQ3831029.1 family 16 glycosylhydrolase [Microbulbifer elongatus]
MKNKLLPGVINLLMAPALSMASDVIPDDSQIDLTQWSLAWSDEFNYQNDQLDKNWISQNGPTEHPLVLGSRWRENAVVEDGVLHLINRKESRGGQDWTSGNVWTKRSFGYGYFEARYKYAGAYGTNNSFWLWPKHGTKEGEKACEVDINEGHYPNIINTNVHNWTDTYTLPDGVVQHEQDQLHHTLDGEPEQRVILDKPVITSKLRLVSTNPASIHIREFEIFESNENAGEYSDGSGAFNLAKADDVTISTSGNFYQLPSKKEFATDGRLDTRWVSNKHGEKWIQFDWDKSRTISALEFVNGWVQEFGASEGLSRNLISDYKIQSWKNGEWQTIAEYDAASVSNYADEYHTFGLAWDEDYFRFYQDGKLYYKMRNDVCFDETSMLFSLAVLDMDIAGPVSDAIDGTSMKVDWVRYYTPKQDVKNMK